MQPTDWSPTERWHRVFAFGLVVLLVGSMASVAAANSAFGFRNPEVSATTVTVDENVTVSIDAVNVGDSGGGITVNFQSNQSVCGTTYCEFDAIRVTVPANSDRRVETNLSFDEPGTYEIRVENKRAGVVTVRPARAQVRSATESQRRIDLRANGVSTGEPTDFDIPPSNRTVAVQRWSTSTGQSSFQQSLTEYTNRSEVPGSVPSTKQSTLFGVVEFESEDEFEASTMQIGVNDSVVSNSSLSSEEVTLYQRTGTVWEPLSTSVVADDGDRTVYEATATRGTTYAVGSMNASISVVNTSYGSAAGDSSVMLTVEGRLRNTGPVAGQYRGTMRVNGETVNSSSVTVPAGGETNISLSHTVTESGQYRLALNRTRAGSVFIPEGQLDDPQSTDSPPGAQSSATGASGDGGSDVSDAVPSTIFGIDTLYVVGGLAIALGAFVAILLLLRRGGDGGGGRPDNFDPW